VNQQREIQKYADENNIRIIGWYKDHGHSGTTANRPEFKRMIKDSEKKNFALVLVWKLDRFSRDLYVGADAKHRLKKNDVALFSVIERIDNTPEGKMIETMFEAVAQYYVGNHARNVLGGMKENALNGLSNGSCTYGYQLQPKLDEHGNIIMKKLRGRKDRVINTYAIHPDNANAVKIMFKMTLQGATQKAILERLKELGHKNASGKDFNATHIEKILRNERYTGVYIFEHNKGKQVNYMPVATIRNDGGIPKIIEREEFDAVQTLMDSRKHRPNSHSAVNYMLTGKVVCGECGEHFTGSSHSKNGQPYYYYRCGGGKNCTVMSVRKERLEDFAMSEMEKVVRSEKYVSQILDRFAEFYKEKNSNNEIIAGLEKRLADIEKKIDNAVEMVLAGGTLKGVFQSKLDTLTDEKTSILKMIEKESSINLNEFITKEQIRRVYFKVLGLLKSGEEQNKPMIIGTLLNRIIVYKERVEVFINLLPTSGSNLDLQITDADLATYGLLDSDTQRKTAHTGDFPTDISVGEPRLFSQHLDPKDYNIKKNKFASFYGKQYVPRYPNKGEILSTKERLWKFLTIRVEIEKKKLIRLQKIK